MVLEIALFTATPGKGAELRAGFLAALPIIRAAQGCRSATLRQQVEDPEQFALLIEWETLDDHIVTFRSGPRFPEYRSHITGLFVDPPVVNHYEVVEG
jgi:quinol monooxygenase YgiN